MHDSPFFIRDTNNIFFINLIQPFFINTLQKAQPDTASEPSTEGSAGWQSAWRVHSGQTPGRQLPSTTSGSGKPVTAGTPGVVSGGTPLQSCNPCPHLHPFASRCSAAGEKRESFADLTSIQ
jgi:hypothetical protein